MKTQFFSFLLIPTLYPVCNFQKYQRQELQRDRLSYQKIVDDSLIVNLKEREEYDQRLCDQVSRCYDKMALDQFGSCDFEQLKANAETRKYDVLVNQRYWKGSNYIYENWLIDSRKYKSDILPARINFYQNFWHWMDRCFEVTNLQTIEHSSVEELYNIIKDSQVQFELRQLKYIPLKKGISLSPNYVNGVFVGSKDGAVSNIEIQYNNVNVHSVLGKRDYANRTKLEVQVLKK